jgi:hypothetical protein
MNKEQSLVMAIRCQMAILGYSESDIDSQELEIEKFAKSIIQSVESEFISQTHTPDVKGYQYYMYINDLTFNNQWEHDALMSTFDGDSEWGRAVDERDIDTCCAIYKEVSEFCKTHRVPYEVFDFVQSTPAKLIAQDWTALEQCPYIVDAYCDQDEDEYVDGITGK